MVKVLVREEIYDDDFGMMDEYKDLKYEFGDSGVMFLHYDPDINRFRDNVGNVIHDIYQFVTPTNVMLFKEDRSMCLVRRVKNRGLVMMTHPDDIPF